MAKKPERKFLPGLSDLVDRLSIVQLKSMYLKEHRAVYLQERDDILHDIDLLLAEAFDKTGTSVNASAIHAITVIMLMNRLIWESESAARAGGTEQDRLLKLTHSLNGQRNAAKNKLAAQMGGRVDFKIDCFAADLAEEFGHLKVFE